MFRCRLVRHNQRIYLDKYIQVTKCQFLHDGALCRIEGLTGPGNE